MMLIKIHEIVIGLEYLNWRIIVKILKRDLVSILWLSFFCLDSIDTVLDLDLKRESA